MGNEAADGGQVWLVNCLNATLDANLQIRQAAEEALKQASLQAGPFPGLNLDPFFLDQHQWFWRWILPELFSPCTLAEFSCVFKLIKSLMLLAIIGKTSRALHGSYNSVHMKGVYKYASLRPI